MAKSTAVSLDRVSRVVGYKIKSGTFGGDTPNLPQRIAILAEANFDKQPILDETPFEFSDARAVGEKMGFGSPAHLIARILRPASGNLLGGIITEMYPVKSPTSGATASSVSYDVAFGGSAPTKTMTHYIVIAGRKYVDGQSYAFTVTPDDSEADVKQKMVDAVNAVLNAPVIAKVDSETGEFEISTKWTGQTGADLKMSIDTNGDDAGVIYSEIAATAGAGLPDIDTALGYFGEKWNTLVVNSFGFDVADILENFNGVPDPLNPTGRYNPTDFRPFVALAGTTVSTIADIAALTDKPERKSQVTNVLCPAPNSDGFSFEAAANMAASTALISQDYPHLGNGGRVYPDMPVPADGVIGEFGDYNGRDQIAKKGSSTVSLENGVYTVQDYFTTYHPDGEYPPKFRKVRDINVDWNLAFGWLIIMKRDIQDKAIIGDSVPVRVSETITPTQAKQLVYSFITEKAALALIADPEFSQDSVEVEINQTNPARLDIFFRYKRTSTADIVSTDAEVDFAFSL